MNSISWGLRGNGACPLPVPWTLVVPQGCSNQSITDGKNEILEHLSCGPAWLREELQTTLREGNNDLEISAYEGPWLSPYFHLTDHGSSAPMRDWCPPGQVNFVRSHLSAPSSSASWTCVLSLFKDCQAISCFNKITYVVISHPDS